ncbi:MAG: hypothetical protein JOZ18_08360 [Chloroflexi bacterium]|nr:hypothetical protein [Chloroflexota bacterium]
MDTTMETMILLVGQFGSSLFLWIGIALLAERATISAFQKRFIQIFCALLFLVWFAVTPLLAQSGFFSAGGVGIPLALVLTLLFGFALMFSLTFRQLLTITPMHWIIGIQVFRVLGGIWLIGYAQGQLPGLFALPAGIGDTLTGLTAPVVAYWFYKNGKGARLIAFIWCLFGTLDLLNAITLANLSNATAVGVLPFVLIPAFGVPRSLVLHGYTFWLLGKRRTENAILLSRGIAKKSIA